MSRWIAADWGTTRLRLTLMDDATPVDTRQSDDGMNRLTQDLFEPTLRMLAGDWLDGPAKIVACGMVGARQGWIEAPYAPVPCSPPTDRPIRVPTDDPALDVRIVPGLSQTSPHPDVLRGEETQIAGILRRHAEFDGVVCLPGTHTKWAHVSAGEIVSFRTVMTGEIFAMLAGQSVLRHSLAGAGWSEAPFLDALSDAISRPEVLTARLFELRAADLLLGQDDTTARSILSGLLIGAELAATKPWWLGREVIVTGSETTTPAYVAALQAQGLRPIVMPADEVTRAGLASAREAP